MVKKENGHPDDGDTGIIDDLCGEYKYKTCVRLDVGGPDMPSQTSRYPAKLQANQSPGERLNADKCQRRFHSYSQNNIPER